MGRAAKNKATGLTDKQEVFAEAIAYDPDLNASDAYRKAYKCGRMKSETINKNAAKLKDSNQIATRIKQLRAERSERTKIDADWVLKSLVAAHDMKISDILSDDWVVRPPSEWPEAWLINLSAFDIQEIISSDDPSITILKKFKWPDKTKLKELIGKHVDVQAFKDRIEATGLNRDPLRVKIISMTDEELASELLKYGIKPRDI